MGKTVPKLPVRVTRNNVVVELLEFRELGGGLVLPEGEVKACLLQHGRVIDIGPGVDHPHTGEPVPMICEIGDHIIFRKHAATEFHIGAAKYFLICDADTVMVWQAG